MAVGIPRKMIHPAFTLDGKAYSALELIHLCNRLLSDQSLPGCEKELFGFIQQWLNNSDTITVRTSGSTGDPKSIALKKSEMIASAQLTQEFFGLQAGQSALLCLPVRYIAGKMMVVRAMLAGLRLKTINASASVMEAISPDETIDFAAMVPAQVFAALKDATSAEKLSMIGTLIIGGAELAFSLENTLRNYPNPIFVTYGMTETITHIALRRINGINPASHYKALPGVQFSQDERQCLVIHASHLEQGPIVTNDMVTLLDAESFYFLGRYDNVINTGGIKVFPEQIEKKLEGEIQGSFYIAGYPDERLGERVVLVMEGEELIDREGMQALFLSCLDPGERPKEIILVEEIGLTSGGKIRRERPS